MSGNGIETNAEYEEALARMDELIDDYDANLSEFAEFNAAAARHESGVA